VPDGAEPDAPDDPDAPVVGVVSAPAEPADPLDSALAEVSASLPQPTKSAHVNVNVRATSIDIVFMPLAPQPEGIARGLRPMST
jgi:hypothetical protein